MKMTIMTLVALGQFMFSTSSYAETDLNKIIKNNDKNQSSNKRSRRKKVQMCHDCGKAETECDCEGEEHGVKDDKETKKMD